MSGRSRRVGARGRSSGRPTRRLPRQLAARLVRPRRDNARPRTLRRRLDSAEPTRSRHGTCCTRDRQPRARERAPSCCLQALHRRWSKATPSSRAQRDQPTPPPSKNRPRKRPAARLIETAPAWAPRAPEPPPSLAAAQAPPPAPPSGTCAQRVSGDEQSSEHASMSRPTPRRRRLGLPRRPRHPASDSEHARCSRHVQRRRTQAHWTRTHSSTRK